MLNTLKVNSTIRKTWEKQDVVIAFTSFFNDNNKFYPQPFLDSCLY